MVGLAKRNHGVENDFQEEGRKRGEEGRREGGREGGREDKNIEQSMRQANQVTGYLHEVHQAGTRYHGQTLQVGRH